MKFLIILVLVLLLVIAAPFAGVFIVNKCFETAYEINSFVEWLCWSALWVIVAGSKYHGD